jgi:hypothetical protein
MQRLPLMFGGLHALFVASIFGSAIAYPARASLLPLFAFVADFPLSLLFEFIARGRLLWDAITYLVFGSLWYYLLGWIFLRLLLWLRGNHEI